MTIDQFIARWPELGLKWMMIHKPQDLLRDVLMDHIGTAMIHELGESICADAARRYKEQNEAALRAHKAEYDRLKEQKTQASMAYYAKERLARQTIVAAILAASEDPETRRAEFRALPLSEQAHPHWQEDPDPIIRAWALEADGRILW